LKCEEEEEREFHAADVRGTAMEGKAASHTKSALPPTGGCA
jgi:hypothetical protein